MQDAEYESKLAYIDSLTQVWEDKLEELKISERDEFLKRNFEEESTPLDTKKGLSGHFPLDSYESLSTQNEQNSLPAKMNTGLIGEVAAVEILDGKSGKALRFDGENFLNLGDLLTKNIMSIFPMALG